MINLIVGILIGALIAIIFMIPYRDNKRIRTQMLMNSADELAAQAKSTINKGNEVLSKYLDALKWVYNTLDSLAAGFKDLLRDYQDKGEQAEIDKYSKLVTNVTQMKRQINLFISIYDGKPYEEKSEVTPPPIPVKTLQEQLELALEKQDYEEAARLRDEIKKESNNNKQQNKQ